MDIISVTVGLPVRDLAAAIEWYRSVLELEETDLAPADGVVEFRLGPVWLQLGQEPTGRSGAEMVLRFGVEDVHAERARLVGLGVDVDEVVHVPGAVDYLDFLDPFGNVLSMYTEL